MQRVISFNASLTDWPSSASHQRKAAQTIPQTACLSSLRPSQGSGWAGHGLQTMAPSPGVASLLVVTPLTSRRKLFWIVAVWPDSLKGIILILQKNSILFFVCLNWHLICQRTRSPYINCLEENNFLKAILSLIYCFAKSSIQISSQLVRGLFFYHWKQSFGFKQS